MTRRNYTHLVVGHGGSSSTGQTPDSGELPRSPSRLSPSSAWA